MVGVVWERERTHCVPYGGLSGPFCTLLTPGTFDIIIILIVFFIVIKTRRGSPVDYRPSTDKLHNFVKEKINKNKNVTRDM